MKGKKTKKRKFRAREIANYSLQFWKDKQGAWVLTETCNSKEPLPSPLTLNFFAFQITQSKLLNKKEKDLFGRFCTAYLRHLDYEQILT